MQKVFETLKSKLINGNVKETLYCYLGDKDNTYLLHTLFGVDTLLGSTGRRTFI